MSSTSVTVNLKTSSSWADSSAYLKNRLAKIKRKLRLAVDTKKLKDLRLEFKITTTNRGKRVAKLVLGKDPKDGKLRIRTETPDQ